MADFTQIIQKINDDINTNGVGAITGAKLNEVLRDMIAAVNAEKQDPLTIDASPTEGSTNPVQSGGVYEALEDKADKVSGATNGNIASFDANGNIQDSGIAASDVATTSDLAGKQDTISDLAAIRSGAAAGATAYQKPSSGVPKSDLASSVQTSLGKADTAIQPAEFDELEEEVSQLEAKVTDLHNDSVKDAVWLSLVGLNKYMNQSGVIGTLNGYDLYEINGLNGGDILIIRENNGNPVLATGLGVLYVCQGILQDDTYIPLINYLKANGAEADNSSVFVFPMPESIKSVYFTKKHGENKDLSFIKVGGEILRGGIAFDFPASLSDISPINIFDSYGGLVYPNPSQSLFAKIAGYEFAYVKLRAGDKVSFDNIDLTNLSTAGWVFSVSNGILTSTAIGLVDEYTATSDCFLCLANKETNTAPVAYFLSKEFQSGIGKVLLQTDPSKSYKFVGCVLRNVEGVWQQLGGAHKSLNVASISQDSEFIRVTYNFVATNVVAFLTTPDEDFASIGYNTGSSVGLQYANIRISQHFTVSGFVRYNGSGWDKYGDATNVVVQNNSVTIYHQNIGGVAATCSVSNAIVCVNILQVGTNFTQVMLYNFDGTPFVNIPNGLGIYFARPYHGEITPANANQSGNIWCLGIMEV